jgi:hypothetical protein
MHSKRPLQMENLVCMNATRETRVTRATRRMAHGDGDAPPGAEQLFYMTWYKACLLCDYVSKTRKER